MAQCPKCQIIYPDDVKHSCAELTIAPDDKKISELTGVMPEVVEDAVNASEKKENQQSTAKEETKPSFKDKKGRDFDPRLHVWDDVNNKPAETPTGRFKRKLVLPEQTTSKGEKTVDPLMVEAGQYTDTINMFAQGILGEEAKFNAGERDAHILAWFKVFQKYGTMPINPWVGLAIVHASFIGSRMDKPRTQAVVEGTITKVKFFFINLYYRAQGKDFKVEPVKQEKKP
jgi:hypothetical protein